MISSQRTLATALLIAASSVCAGAQAQSASEKGAGAKYALVTRGQVGTHGAGWFQFQPLWQRITREQPDLFD